MGYTVLDTTICTTMCPAVIAAFTATDWKSLGPRPIQKIRQKVKNIWSYNWVVIIFQVDTAGGQRSEEEEEEERQEEEEEEEEVTLAFVRAIAINSKLPLTKSVVQPVRRHCGKV